MVGETGDHVQIKNILNKAKRTYEVTNLSNGIGQFLAGSTSVTFEIEAYDAAGNLSKLGSVTLPNGLIYEVEDGEDSEMMEESENEEENSEGEGLFDRIDEAVAPIAP